MEHTIEKQIIESVERLKWAMLHSDINVLDELLAPDLVFTTHFGKLITKQDDLEAYKSGILKIKNITYSDQNIKIIEGVAVVTVLTRILGSIAGDESDSDFRFTRVWKQNTNKAWQVVVGHACLVT